MNEGRIFLHEHLEHAKSSALRKIKKIMGYDGKLKGPLKEKVGALLDDFTASVQDSVGGDDGSLGDDSISTLGGGSVDIQSTSKVQEKKEEAEKEEADDTIASVVPDVFLV